MSCDDQRSGMQWPREDTTRLLCLLNLHIKTVRMLVGIEELDDVYVEGQGVTSEQRILAKEKNSTGIDTTAVAAAFITHKFGNSCPSSRVQNKLRNLWNKYGSMNVENPKPLYTYGACTWTLSGLEKKHPGILMEIASTVRQMQEEIWQKSKPNITQSLSQSTRRSRRLEQKVHPQETVRCRCGFTHDIAGVYCERCSTWQHAYCYYDTEDSRKLPDRHRCDNCVVDMNKASPVSPEISGLTIKTSTLSLDHADSQASSLEGIGRDKQLGPFGIPTHSKLFWGPNDSFIQDRMRSCLSAIQRFTAPLVHPKVSAKQIAERMQAAPDDFISLFERLHGTEYSVAVRKLAAPQKESSRMTIGNLLLGLVTSLVTEFALGDRQQPDSLEALILNSVSRLVLSQNGPDNLSNLKRESILAILQSSSSDSSRLSLIHAQQASELRHECLQILSHVLPAQLRDISKQGCTEYDPDDPSQPDVLAIDEALSMLLDLKLRMNLSECCYEIYIPKSGVKAVPGLMMNEVGGLAHSSQKCELCLMPGLIEYSKQISSQQKVIFGDCFIVKVSDEERQQGRVASPAIVMLS